VATPIQFGPTPKANTGVSALPAANGSTAGTAAGFFSLLTTAVVATSARNGRTASAIKGQEKTGTGQERSEKQQNKSVRQSAVEPASGAQSGVLSGALLSVETSAPIPVPVLPGAAGQVNKVSLIDGSTSPVARSARAGTWQPPDQAKSATENSAIDRLRPSARVDAASSIPFAVSTTVASAASTELTGRSHASAQRGETEAATSVDDRVLEAVPAAWRSSVITAEVITHDTPPRFDERLPEELLATSGGLRSSGHSGTTHLSDKTTESSHVGGNRTAFRQSEKTTVGHEGTASSSTLQSETLVGPRLRIQSGPNNGCDTPTAKLRGQAAQSTGERSSSAGNERNSVKTEREIQISSRVLQSAPKEIITGSNAAGITTEVDAGEQRNPDLPTHLHHGSDSTEGAGGAAISMPVTPLSRDQLASGQVLATQAGANVEAQGAVVRPAGASVAAGGRSNGAKTKWVTNPHKKSEPEQLSQENIESKYELGRNGELGSTQGDAPSMLPHNARRDSQIATVAESVDVQAAPASHGPAGSQLDDAGPRSFPPGNQASESPAGHDSYLHAARIYDQAARTEMRVSLRTHEAGGIEVRTFIRDGQAGAVIAIEKGEVRNAVLAEIHSLHNALQERHVEIGQLAVTDYTGNTAGSGSHSPQDNNRHSPTLRSGQLPIQQVSETEPRLEPSAESVLRGERSLSVHA
jgi:Flagellar hook-length control protein FliK